jgi:hypothetical protein
MGGTEGAATPPATGTESAMPTETPAADATDGEDLFGDPTGATEEAATPPANDSSSILREPGGLTSSELRTWVDNTGEFSCQGRLVRFMDGKVQLLKDNGRTTTVPLYRLSASDLEFVNRQASAQQAQAAERVAEASVGEPLAAN